MLVFSRTIHSRSIERDLTRPLKWSQFYNHTSNPFVRLFSAVFSLGILYFGVELQGIRISSLNNDWQHFALQVVGWKAIYFAYNFSGDSYFVFELPSFCSSSRLLKSGCLSVDLFCTLKTRLLFECWFVLYAQYTTAVWVLICSVRSKHDCCLSVDLFCTLKTRLLFECWFVLYAQNKTAVWVLICSVRSKHDCCLSVDLFCTLKTRLLLECWFVFQKVTRTPVSSSGRRDTVTLPMVTGAI